MASLVKSNNSDLNGLVLQINNYLTSLTGNDTNLQTLVDNLQNTLDSFILITNNSISNIYTLIDNINAQITVLNGQLGVITNQITDLTNSVSLLTIDVDNIINQITPPLIETDDNVLIGQPVYIKNTGHAGLAQAIFPTQNCIGLVNTSVNAGIITGILNNTVLTLSDWTNVIGSELLSPGVLYFLDPNNSGMLTSTVPSIGYNVIIGEALTANTLQINIEDPCLL